MPFLHFWPVKRLFSSFLVLSGSWCSLFWRSIPYAMPLLHGGSSISRRQSIYSAVHNFLGSQFSWRRSSCVMPLLHGG
jgi:hypothetical protein